MPDAVVGEFADELIFAGDDGGKIGLDDRAFDKFERMREKVEQAEAEAEALAELQGFDSSPASDFDDAPVNSDIEAQLEKLKRKKQDG